MGPSAVRVCREREADLSARATLVAKQSWPARRVAHVASRDRRECSR